MKLLKSLLLACAVVFACRDASAQTATTKPIGLLNVQGVLHENGQPVNGFMWFCFDWFTTPTGGTSLAHDTNMNQVMVSNGVANVLLNIGDLSALRLSPTQEYYLQLDVSRTGEPGSFTVLNPRQRIVPSVFASMAVRAEEARRLIEPISAALLPPSLPGLSFTSAPTFAAVSGPPFIVTSSAIVAGLDADLLDGLDSSAFWQLAGNAGTAAGLNFLGTTDDEPLELKVNNTRALRLEPTSTSPNLIGGHPDNSARENAHGVTISGGGGGLGPHRVSAKFGAIGGGDANLIENNAYGATISGGWTNVIRTNAYGATIGGGWRNNIETNAFGSTIGGGWMHTIVTNAQAATVAGGHSNTIYTTAGVIGGGVRNSLLLNTHASTIGGGQDNLIGTGGGSGGSDPAGSGAGCAFATISGGGYNAISQSWYGTIGGGYTNDIESAGLSTIAGGYYNRIQSGAYNASIGGGLGNTVTNAANSTIAGGYTNTIQTGASGSTIGGGTSQIVEMNVTNGVIAGGRGNVIHSNANYSAIGGGRENHIGSSARYAAIPGGRGARATDYGQMAHASGTFLTAGDAQSSLFVLRGVSSSAESGAWAELFLDGVSERMHPTSPGAWTYHILIAGRNNTGSHGFHLVGYVGLEPGAITVAPLTTDGTNTLFNARVIGDLADGSLRVQVRWQMASSDTKWVASVRTAEVMLPAN